MTRTVLHHDFETRSLLNLPDVGLDNYSRHPSTKVLVLAWAVNDEPVQLWEPHRGPMPGELRRLIESPAVIKSAWNSTFERMIWRRVLKIDIPYREWHDPMVNARYMSMPGYLDEVGKILGIKEENLKMDAGSMAKKASKVDQQGQILRIFSRPVDRKDYIKTLFKREEDARIAAGIKPPRKTTKTARMEEFAERYGLDKLPELVFFDHQTHPEKWVQLGEYCKQDVVAERAVDEVASRYPLPDTERKMWMLDQRINERGMPTNTLRVAGAVAIADQAEAEIAKQLADLTGLENPNSTQQFMPWLKERHYPFNSLGKDFVTLALKGTSEPPLSPEAIDALKLRQESSKTSHKKYHKVLAVVGPDNRLRNQFQFLGSARAGRWSGHDVQMQNLKRPIKELEDNKKLEQALRCLEFGDYEGMKTQFKASPLTILGSCIRSVFEASPGHRLVVCDLNAIENRVLGWVAKCAGILEVFALGRDPYLSFGASLFNEPYEQLKAAYDAKDPVAKEKRQAAKPAVLGAGYRLGGGDIAKDKDGNEIKTGLWGYAEGMGIALPKEECHRAVKIFRETYSEVVQLWYDLEKAAMKAIRHRGRRYEAGRCIFQADELLMKITLPSGRSLHYINPRIEKREFFNQIKDTVVYDGMAHLGKGQKQVNVWGPVTTHGGKLTENIVQAISRDLLRDAMFRAEMMGFIIVGHVHDEIVSEVQQHSHLHIEHLRECMVAVPKWAPDLPLDAAGYEGKLYKKE